MRANRIVIMTRGKLNVQELHSPPDLSAATRCILTELIKTFSSSMRIKSVFWEEEASFVIFL